MAVSADRVGGAVWIVFGIAVAYASWAMDRLESLKIPPLTAPGLLPGLLGLGFIVFGLILLLRGVGPEAAAAAPAEPGHPRPARGGSAGRRLVLSWALCIAYAGVFLGRGLPYWLLTMVFLFAHLVLLDESDRVRAIPSRRRLVTAAVLAPTMAVGVALMFQHIFLVRLP
jgi:hypothetical protein